MYHIQDINNGNINKVESLKWLVIVSLPTRYLITISNTSM